MWELLPEVKFLTYLTVFDCTMSFLLPDAKRGIGLATTGDIPPYVFGICLRRNQESSVDMYRRIAYLLHWTRKETPATNAGCSLLAGFLDV